MEIFKFLLLLAGFILFVGATFSAPSKLNLLGAGLACWILVPLITLIQGLHLD